MSNTVVRVNKIKKRVMGLTQSNILPLYFFISFLLFYLYCNEVNLEEASQNGPALQKSIIESRLIQQSIENNVRNTSV